MSLIITFAVLLSFPLAIIDAVLPIPLSGYSAIIIHNIGSDEAMPMAGSPGVRVNIPVVSIGEFQASDLLTRYSFHRNPLYTIVISGKYSNKRHMIEINAGYNEFVSIFALVKIFIFPLSVSTTRYN